MARPSRLLRAASRNSRASRIHISCGTGPGCFTAATTRSIILFETSNTANGIKALATRKARPPATTRGAASHTSLKTGGTFRNAAKRSRQAAWCEETDGDIVDASLIIQMNPKARLGELGS